MKISYDFGHMPTGNDISASGFVNEWSQIREYAPICVAELVKRGHELINCTPTANNMSLDASLEYRVAKANESGSALHICFHINAYSSSEANGAEIEIASNAGVKYADSVLTEICKLGFTKRGVKTPDLYVTKNTNMTAILIEPFFCTNKSDCTLYNASKLGLACATGIINIIGGNVVEQVKPVVVEPVKPVVVEPVKPVEKPVVVVPVATPTYRIIVGSFKNVGDADAKILELKRINIESFMEVIK